MTFAQQMRDLEAKFAAAAAMDGDIYLPNFTPSAPVDAVLIGMEPSLGRWARTPEKAAEVIAAGFRNFMWSPEDFILHYAAQNFLCSPGQTYHITDVSKGAMKGDKANIDRPARYARWAALLNEEIAIIAKPGAHVIAIGKAVGGFLERSGFSRSFTTVMHYSPLASVARNAAVQGREAEFRDFADRLSLQDIVDAAEEVMRRNAVPPAMSADAIARVRKGGLSESRKKLAFVYATQFQMLRQV